MPAVEFLAPLCEEHVGKALSDLLSDQYGYKIKVSLEPRPARRDSQERGTLGQGAVD